MHPGGGSSLAGLALIALALAAACGPDTASQAPASKAPPVPLFEDVTLRWGLPDPAGVQWPDGRFRLVETTGTGLGFLDYDGDGDLDLLHVHQPPPDRPQAPAPNRLWRHDPGGRFTNVSEASGLAHPGFGQGVAIADVNQDGRPDVYITNYGPDALFLNQGDGTFRDITAEAGIRDDAWSSAATFCDYDADGDLDLYVVHYVLFEPTATCVGDDGRPEYCGPQNFRGVPDTLYRNDGRGRFEDVTRSAGIVLPSEGERARGLGVLCADLTGDGRADFYVANDGEPNQLWVNQGDGTFRDEAILRGVAVNRHGRPEASMGVTVGDVNGDGLLDLFMTHLDGENNTLYTATDGPLFQDDSARSGLAAWDRAFTGFGCALADLDLDGDLDLLAVNGRVYRGEVHPGAAKSSFWNAYAEPNFLFLNDGTGRFEPAPGLGGAFTREVEVSRGLALADWDDDGDLDVAVSNHDNTLRLYENHAERLGRHWLELRVLDGLRDAVGGQVTLVRGERRWVRMVQPVASYLSVHDPRVHFGLGSEEGIDHVEVVWPDGDRERFLQSGRADRVYEIRKGEGGAP